MHTFHFDVFIWHIKLLYIYHWTVHLSLFPTRNKLLKNWCVLCGNFLTEPFVNISWISWLFENVVSRGIFCWTGWLRTVSCSLISLDNIFWSELIFSSCLWSVSPIFLPMALQSFFLKINFLFMIGHNLDFSQAWFLRVCWKRLHSGLF